MKLIKRIMAVVGVLGFFLAWGAIGCADMGEPLADVLPTIIAGLAMVAAGVIVNYKDIT